MKTSLKTFKAKLRACLLHGGGGPQVGGVQPLHPGVHFLKIIEWSLST